RFGVPNLRRLVGAAADDAFAVRADRHPEDRARMPLEGAYLSPRFRIPYLHRPIVAPAHDAFAVRAECHAPAPAPTPLQLPLPASALDGALPSPRCGLPNPHRPVVAAADDPFTVRADRHTADPARVPLEGAYLPPGFGVPHLHRSVIAPGDDAFAVRAKGHAV